jgi:hypothetical protein
MRFKLPANTKEAPVQETPEPVPAPDDPDTDGDDGDDTDDQ